MKLPTALARLALFLVWAVLMFGVYLLFFVAVALMGWAEGLALIWSGGNPFTEWATPWSFLE